MDEVSQRSRGPRGVLRSPDEHEVHQVIVGHLTRRGLSESRIVRAASWTRDLGIDSLDTLTLIQELEDVFGVRISQEEAMDVQTVGDAIDFVVSRSAA